MVDPLIKVEAALGQDVRVPGRVWNVMPERDARVGSGAAPGPRVPAFPLSNPSERLPCDHGRLFQVGRQRAHQDLFISRLERACKKKSLVRAANPRSLEREITASSEVSMSLPEFRYPQVRAATQRREHSVLLGLRIP